MLGNQYIRFLKTGMNNQQEWINTIIKMSFEKKENDDQPITLSPKDNCVCVVSSNAMLQSIMGISDCYNLEL